MRISVNDTTVTLQPRVAEMVQSLIRRQPEIEQYSSAEIRIRYSTFQLEIQVIPPPERRKLDQSHKSAIN
jgi:hypothetical protein